MKEFVEKLIGRLENRIKYNELCHKEFPNAKMSFTYEVQINAYKNAIEIVNQLAEEYNNGFCEWKLDGVYLLCQHNTELVISCLEEEKHRYKYCPYCGKKIKVVEPYKEGSEE